MNLQLSEECEELHCWCLPADPNHFMVRVIDFSSAIQDSFVVSVLDPVWSHTLRTSCRVRVGQLTVSCLMGGQIRTINKGLTFLLFMSSWSRDTVLTEGSPVTMTFDPVTLKLIRIIFDPWGVPLCSFDISGLKGYQFRGWTTNGTMHDTPCLQAGV